MGRVYTARHKIVGLSAAKTLLYITVANNTIVELLASAVGNATNATNEQLHLCWQKVDVLGAPTATTITPSKHDKGDAAAAATIKADVTASEPSYLANTELGFEGVASLVGYRWPLRDDESPVFAGGETWGLRLLLPAVPASFDAIISATFRERG
jgi:hypothetical protein